MAHPGSFLCQVMCWAQSQSPIPSLSSFALLFLVLSLFAMLKVDLRNKVDMIVHAISKIVLGNHSAKNVYGNVNYASKIFIQGTS
jgi:hypothetical protein